MTTKEIGELSALVQAQSELNQRFERFAQSHKELFHVPPPWIFHVPPSWEAAAKGLFNGIVLTPDAAEALQKQMEADSEGRGEYR